MHFLGNFYRFMEIIWSVTLRILTICLGYGWNYISLSWNEILHINCNIETVYPQLYSIISLVELYLPMENRMNWVMITMKSISISYLWWSWGYCRRIRGSWVRSLCRSWKLLFCCIEICRFGISWLNFSLRLSIRSSKMKRMLKLNL